MGRMRTYGQYCPVARTAEIVAERWTPIVLRNLLTGCATFGELRAGAPGIPKALLADRLATLERAGIVASERVGRGRRYAVTERGRDLQPVLDAMGQWGMRWLEVEPRHADPAYVLWATCKLVEADALPDEPVVVRVELTDQAHEWYWLLLRRPRAEVCTRYVGADEALVVRTTAHTLAQWHLRKVTYAQALRDGSLAVDGAPWAVRAFATWFRPSPHAEPPPAAR